MDKITEGGIDNIQMMTAYLKASISRLRQREPRLKLDLQQYRLLREEVLQRDGWRCQLCGSMKNLQVHHRKFRSLLGDDAAQNSSRCVSIAIKLSMIVVITARLLPWTFSRLSSMADITRKQSVCVRISQQS